MYAPVGNPVSLYSDPSEAKEKTIFCGFLVKPIEASVFAYKSQCLLFILPSSFSVTLKLHSKQTINLRFLNSTAITTFGYFRGFSGQKCPVTQSDPKVTSSHAQKSKINKN